MEFQVNFGTWPKSKIVQLLWFSQGKNKVSFIPFNPYCFCLFSEMRVKFLGISWQNVMNVIHFIIRYREEKLATINRGCLSTQVNIKTIFSAILSVFIQICNHDYIYFFLQRCHEPRVVDSEVNDPRHVWYCVQCVRRMREMVFLIYVLLLCTQILSKFFCQFFTSHFVQHCIAAIVWQPLFDVETLLHNS